MTPQNNQRPEKIRLFIAIFPPPPVLAALGDLQKKLKEVVPKKSVRWTEPSQVHLTLEFLGYIETNLVGEFRNAIKQTVSQTGVFTVSCKSIGCFPNSHRPRIIWAGLDSADSLKLKEGLDDRLRILGHKVEERKFHPHFTLGRINHLSGAQARRLGRKIATVESSNFGEWQVEEIKLMQSKLSSAGAHYSVLENFLLAKC
jgi:2'-5' RNA ligase